MSVHVHQDGLLALEFVAVDAARTAIADRLQRFPLRTTAATFPDDRNPGMPWVILQNPTGGVFPGDRLEIRIAANERARAHVRNQSATKVYGGDGDPAEQLVKIVAAPDSFVEYFGDVLIPHAHSVFTQKLRVELSCSSRVVCGETLASGRVAHGERFEFSSIRLGTDIWVDGRLACSDVLEFKPSRRDPGLRGGFGKMNYLSTVIALLPDGDAEALAAAADALLAEELGLAAGATVLPSGAGVVVRAMSMTAEEARRGVRTAWNVLRTNVVGAPLPARLS